jgi:hypothetical protein
MVTKSECCEAELLWFHCDECDPAHDLAYCASCQQDLVA